MRHASRTVDQYLAQVFQEVFRYKDELTDDLEPSSVSGWDSVGHIALIEAVESRFGIRVTTEEMLEMTTVNRIKDILRDHDIRESNGH